MPYVARILLIWLLFLLTVLSHELGHALGHRVATGKAGWKVIAGSGPEILSAGRFVFCLIPVGGFFVPEEEIKTKKERLAMLAGGPLVSLLLTILIGICYFCCFRSIQPGDGLRESLSWVCSFLLYANFFQFLFTAIPIRYRVVCRGHESDGLQIVHVLRGES